MICPQAQNVLLMFSKTGLLFIWTHFPLCSDTVAIFILELYLNCKFPPWYIPLFFWLFSDCILEKRKKKTFLIKQSINNWILVTFHTNFSYATGPWVKCYWHLWQPEKKSWTRLMNDILIHTCGRLRLANDKLILDSQSEILLCPLNREMCLSQKPKDNIYKRQNQ